jgi:hypothetical protein
MTISYSLVNGSLLMPMMAEAMAICPVEDMGRNSVMPSMIASNMACTVSMMGICEDADRYKTKKAMGYIAFRQIIFRIRLIFFSS